MESCISLGGTIFYSLSLRKNTSWGKDIFLVDPPTQSVTSRKIYALDTKKKSVTAINYSLSARKCLLLEIYSIVRKRHNTKPE